MEDVGGLREKVVIVWLRGNFKVIDEVTCGRVYILIGPSLCTAVIA